MLPQKAPKKCPHHTIRCAVIGVGNMGSNHVRIYDDLAISSLCAIADIDKERARTEGKKYHVPYYDDFQKLIAEQKPDAVSICVPSASHYAVAKYCIEHGIHVLLEKPIAITIEEGKQLLHFAKMKGITFLVGHVERFNPAVQRVKEMIDRNDLGRITSLIIRRVGGFPPQIKDANIAVDLAIHDIDIANYLLQELPKEIIVNKQRTHIKKREDSVEFFLKYSYASAYIQTNWITPVKIRKLNVTGTEGYLEMDYVSQQIEFYKSHYEKLKENTRDFSDYILRFSEPDKITIAVAKKEPLREEIVYFLDCIKNKRTIDASFALEALKIAIT